MLLQDFLFSSAKENPHKPALIYGQNTVSYLELEQKALSLANWLIEQQLKPGFRGAILSDDPLEYIAAYFGIVAAGGVALGMNTQTTSSSVQYILEDSRAAALFVGSKFQKFVSKGGLGKTSLQCAVSSRKHDFGEIACALFSRVFEGPAPFQPMPFRAGCDFGQIIYTSGTTGKPKGVVLRHRNLIANTRSIIEYLQLTSEDRVMAVLPFFYSYGNSVLLTHIAAGGTLVVNQNFMYPNVILEQMQEHGVTGFSGVPSTFALLLNRSALSSYQFPHLRYVTQAGASMSPEMAGRIKQSLPDVEIFIMYGQTEACARLAYLPPEFLETKAGSIGKGIPGVQLRLLDKGGFEVGPGETGEIVARGENIMACYWERDEETAKMIRSEGLWTGDLARRDEDGFLYIVSRKSDMIKSGSHRIGPKEIEDVLSSHPQVQEVAVLGVRDEILDERIRACIVFTEEGSCTDKELRLFCRKWLAPYKVPHEYVRCEELPKTVSGKVIKEKLQ